MSREEMQALSPDALSVHIQDLSIERNEAIAVARAKEAKRIAEAFRRLGEEAA